jgi:hypothetical protein
VGVVPFIYWSSSTNEHDPIYARGANIRDGTIGISLKVSAALLVWPVRGGSR